MEETPPPIDKSIIHLNFCYPYKIPIYEDFEKQVEVWKYDYQLKLEKLKQLRNDLMPSFSKGQVIKLAYEQKELVNGTLKEIIKTYDPLLESKPVEIFWNGSFARNSNRLSSDYDLNFLYPESLRSEILPVEEQICASLARVLNQPRDLVHPALCCHLPLLIDSKLPDDIKKMIFRMYWTEQKPESPQEYDISLGLENLMFNSHWATREPGALRKYLLDNTIHERCEDWTMTYEVIHGQGTVQDIFKSVVEKEKTLSQKDEFVSGLNKLLGHRCGFLADQRNRSYNFDQNKVQLIKENYKSNPLEQIFLVLSLIRRRLLLEGVDLGPIKMDGYAANEDVKRLLGEQMFERFSYQIFHYVWATMRLESIFEKKGIRFGSHSKETIDSSFGILYRTECPDVGDDFHAYHKNLIGQAYTVLEGLLNSIKINR